MTHPAAAGPALVLHHGALGDTIHLTAMLAALAGRWGGPCDVVSGPIPSRVIFAGLPAVGEARNLRERKAPYFASRNQRQLVRWLAGRPAGPCYLLEARRHTVAPWSDATRFEWLLARAGVPDTHRLTMVEVPRRPLEHAVDYLLRYAALDPPAFAGRGGPPPEPPPRPRLAVTPEEVAECRVHLASLGWGGESLVLMQTQTRQRRKGLWPDERWCELIRRVGDRLPEARVMLIGAPSERPHTARLAAAVGDPRVRDAAADFPLRRLFALLTLAHSLVSLDTAPAHAAAVLGCPVVVIFGRADPRRNRPPGDPAQVAVVTAWEPRDWPDDPARWYAEHDITAIPVEPVFEAWQRLTGVRGTAPGGPRAR